MSSLLRGKSVDIVRVQDNKCEVDSNAIKSVLGKLNPSIPVCTLSIFGPFREGKSFFLNLVVLYLQYLSDHSGYKTPLGEIPQWLNGDGCISNGFQFQSGSKGVTNGISMWSEVFMINRYGKQMYVVLLDSQGLYDNNKNEDMDKCIFGMTTFLSSYQIFNFSKNLNTLFFDSLSDLSSFVKEYRQINNATPFQHFSFLCRDYGNFSYNCSLEKNIEEAKELKESYFANTANGDNKEKEAQLLEMFKTVSSFALPEPGRGVACRSPSGKISDIDEFFRQLVGYYIESIIENIEPLQVKEDEVTAKNLSSYMIDIFNAFADPTQFPDTSMMLNMQEFLRAREKINEIGLSAKEKLWMMFYQGNRKYVEPSRLQECFNRYMKEAEDSFNNQFPIKNMLIDDEFGRIKSSIKEYYNSIKSINDTIKPYTEKYGHRRFGVAGPRKTRTVYPELKSIPPNPRSLK